jgi:hypothetical protein
MIRFSTSGRSLKAKAYLSGLGISLLLLSLVLMLGCSTANENAPNNNPQASPAAQNSPVIKKTTNYITATPNPVPVGPEPLGKTTIAWRTQGVPAQDVHVYAFEAGGKESLFATGSEGAQEAPWIPSDRSIDFRLYAGSGNDRKLLDSVSVIRNK